MKQLLKAMMVLCMAINALAVQAQLFKMERHLDPMLVKSGVTLGNNTATDETGQYVKMFANGRSTFYAKQESANLAEQQNQHSVTINLEGIENEDDYPMPYFYIQATIVNKQLWRNVSFRMSNMAQTTVPEGKYDVICNFPYQALMPRWVILEEFEINSDTTITLNPNMATRRISFKDYMPNGELLRLDLGHPDEETGQWIVTQKGNVVYASILQKMYNKDYGNISDIAIDYAGYNTDEEMATCADADFFVSEVSDRFVFTQDRIAADEDINWYVTHFSTDDCNAETVENSADNYLCHETMFDFSPYGMEHQGYGYALQHVFIDSQGNLRGGNRPQVSVNLEHGKSLIYRTFINFPGCFDPMTRETSVYLPSIFEMSSQSNPSYYEYPLQGAAFKSNEDGTILNVGLGHPFNGSGGINLAWLTHSGLETNPFVTRLLPAHTAFTYDKSKQLNHYGASCPINDVITRSAPNCYYVGQYGEVRFSDNLAMTTTYKFNGEEVEQLPAEKGVCEISFLNTNVAVDELNGRNATTIHYDSNLDDSIPPTLRMLHFRDNDNNIINNFSTSADGTMEFAAGDYNWIPDGWFGEFECKPMEVTVEYAPYGTEEWAELSVEEIPELFQMPGWGYFYRGSLAGVSGQAEKGWFDLKFRLVDESGNWQEQVVSPAFRIDDLAYSGVSDINGGDAVEVARYSIDGKRVDASHHGVVIVRMSDGTAHKVLAP